MLANIPDTNVRSDKPMLIEVIFAGRAFKGVPPVLLHRDFVESFTITLVDEGAWKGQLVLFDRSGDFIFNIVTVRGYDRTILLRWGWDDGHGLESYPQYVGKYLTVVPTFTAEGVRLTFDLVAAEAHDQALVKGNRSFDAGTLISDAVQEIATERKWRTEDRQGRPTIETTASKLDAALVQRGETDFKFIRTRLRKRAVNEAKRGPYRFYLDDTNAVHFHTDSFLSKRVVKEYTFGQDVMGDVIEFAPQDLQFFATLLDGASAVFWSIDSLAGQRVRMASTELGGLPGATPLVPAGAAYLASLLESLPPYFAEKISGFKAITARSEEDFENKVRARFAAIRTHAYLATLTVRGTHEVLPTKLVQVDYFTPVHQIPHFLSGVFYASEVEHEVGVNGWQVRMSLHREGIQQTDGAKEMENVEKATSERPPLRGSSAARAAKRSEGRVVVNERFPGA